MTFSKRRASAFAPRLTPWLASLMLGVMMTACATPPQNPTTRPPVYDRPVIQNPDGVDPQLPKPREEEPEKTPEEEADEKDAEIAKREGLTPPHMQGRPIRRVALLLPFSASNSRLRTEAGSMLQAAEMAVFDRDRADVLLIALDTAGTEDGTRMATQKAMDAGADIILGPVLAPNVTAARDQSRRVDIPIIAFSTNQAVAGDGVYLLSFPPEAEVERITRYAAAQGARRFALLGPNNGYTRRVEPAYRRAVSGVGAQYVITQTYSGSSINDMQGPASELARAYLQGGQRFDAVLLPESGTALRSLGPLLPYYNVNPASVKFIGTSLWDRLETTREPALRGGIFAAPDKDASANFKSAFEATYDAKPSTLASQAYDGISIAALIAEDDPKDRKARLTDPQGFYGVDGFVRFRVNGTPERGLAVYEVRQGQFVLIDPAPKTAEDLGITLN
ncbi:penicillin-binding protein activator [Robiginitomaculum antarcticum]|uniref:penicillin-binding protein activator n=1 Tax=Robiginitomaculum antarcticum TaxID=437507 RepID=UPI00039D1175|nr:penicillin-binding protein activator [Robiginitomaculum antarcticum]